MHRTIQLTQWPPRRIVSLVPSQTELLAELGLEEQVLGITKFCIHPPHWYQNKTRIGGTKTLNLAKIAALQPDLILGNKEENDQTQIETLAASFPVWMSDIATLEDALHMIREIGRLTDKPAPANALADNIMAEFARLPGSEKPARVAYLIWRKPYMAAGNHTFIHEMLQHAGFENVFAHKTRYPEITLADLQETQPDAVLLSSEPYPFAAKHLAELQQACPGAAVLLVDGEIFSWYGSRLQLAPAYFRSLSKSLKLAVLQK